MITIDEALKQAVIALEGGESPSVDAKVLLCHVLDKTQTYLFTWPDNTLTASELSAYQALIERRKQGYPVSNGDSGFLVVNLGHLQAYPYSSPRYGSAC